MKIKRTAFLYVLMFLIAAPVFAQTAAISDYCVLGAKRATTSGLNSSNYLQGVIPQCTVTVYLTGTTTLATIYADASSTVLTNPFTANTDGSWLFYTAVNQGYDVVLSGGISPNVYSSPVTLTDLFPGFSFTGIAGSGTPGYVPVFTGTNSLGNSSTITNGLASIDENPSNTVGVTNIYTTNQISSTATSSSCDGTNCTVIIPNSFNAGQAVYLGGNMAAACAAGSGSSSTKVTITSATSSQFVFDEVYNNECQGVIASAPGGTVTLTPVVEITPQSTIIKQPIYTYFEVQNACGGIGIGNATLDNCSPTGQYNHNNIAMGDSAMYDMGGSNNQYNVAIGNSVLEDLGNYPTTLGEVRSNIAIGDYAMHDTASSTQYNVAIGENVMEDSSSSPTYNVAIGYHTMSDAGNSANNIAIGDNAMEDNAGGGGENIAIGHYAIMFDTNGATENVAIGHFALENASGPAIRDVAIGGNAGGYITTGHVGSNSVFIGYNSLPKAGGETNENVIGNESTGAGSNSTTLGNSSITKFVAYGTGDGCLSSTSGLITGSGSPCFPTNPMTTLGDTLYGGASGTATRLPGNITTLREFLCQTGDGTNSAAPAWCALNSSDVTTALSYTPTNAAVVPSTAPSAGQLLVGNAGGTAYAPLSLSGDCTLASTGAITCTKSGGTAFGTAAFAAIADYLTTVSAASTYATLGANSNITSLTGLTTPLSTAQGGTGAGVLTGYRHANSSGADTASTTIPAADIASGALASGMTATTQASGDNSTKIATTAFVLANSSSILSSCTAGESSAITGTGSYIPIFSCSIPANTIPTGGCLRAKAFFKHTGSTSVGYQWIVGSTNAGTQSSSTATGAGGSAAVTACATASGTTDSMINSDPLIMGSTLAAAGGSATGGTQSWSSTFSLTLQFNVANTDTVTPQGFLVEILRP